MVITCTKQLLDEIGVPSVKPEAEFDPMYTWSANLIRINRRKTLVAVHAASRAILVLYGITAKHKKLLPQLIKDGIRALLESEHIKTEMIDAYLDGYGSGVSFYANQVRAHVNYCTHACNEVLAYADLFREDDLYQKELLPHINAMMLASKQYQYAYESLAECFSQKFGEDLYSCCMLELDVTLDLQTECRRVLRIPDTLNFVQLHHVLQAAFGWHDCHLHEFVLETDRNGKISHIVAPTYDDSDDLDDIRGVRRLDPQVTLVDDILDRYGTIEYVYDFGDGWTHTIRLVDVIENVGIPYPQCTLAVGDAPMEDCGGPGGFSEIMQIMNDPNHPEHTDICRWVASSFWHPLDAERINRRIRHAHRDR